MKHISLTIYVHLSHSLHNILVTLLIIILQQSLNLSISLILSFSLSPSLSLLRLPCSSSTPSLSTVYYRVSRSYRTYLRLYWGDNNGSKYDFFLYKQGSSNTLNLRYTGSKRERQKIEKRK